MDIIDRSILSEVCANCRVSYETLARKTGLSPNAVKNRVSNLIESGVFSQFRTILDHRYMDAESFQGVVITDGTEDIESFVQTMGASPMVGHINTMATVKGGAYLLWGLYAGTGNLYELASALRGLQAVKEVEIHPLRKRSVPEEPKKLKFTKTQLRVLRALIENPRMQMSEISQKTGISPKTVRRALRDITESERINFVARPDLAAGSLVNLNLRISWDEKKISIEELVNWLREEYPIAFWVPWISASDPVVFAEFMVEDLHDAESISKRVRGLPFVMSTSTLVSYSTSKFPYLAEIMLEDMVAKVGK